MPSEPSPNHSRKPFSVEELATLRLMATTGATVREIAQALGRHYDTIYITLRRLKLKVLKTTGHSPHREDTRYCPTPQEIAARTDEMRSLRLRRLRQSTASRQPSPSGIRVCPAPDGSPHYTGRQ